MTVHPCPECGERMGDGDRVHHGMCGRCWLTRYQSRTTRTGREGSEQ